MNHGQFVSNEFVPGLMDFAVENIPMGKTHRNQGPLKPSRTGGKDPRDASYPHSSQDDGKNAQDEFPEPGPIVILIDSFT